MSARHRLHRWVWPLILSVACGGGRDAAPPAAGDPPEIAETKSLLAAGRYDDALARLQNSRAPEAAYLEAEAWAGKAETAPLPTPEALPPEAPRDAVAVTPEFKPEELRAIELYERAVTALPKDPRPPAGLAKLLAPHAQRRYEAEQAAAAEASRRGPKGRVPAPTPMPPGPDFSPGAVARLYRQAAEKSSTVEPIEALYAYAVHVGALEEADWALRERIRRENENPDHMLRYGDFLRDVKKDPLAAVAQYRQVLFWRPDDTNVKARIGDVFTALGAEHYKNGEHATADARYTEALKWFDRSSPRYAELERELARVRRVRRQ